MYTCSKHFNISSFTHFIIILKEIHRRKVYFPMRFTRGKSDLCYISRDSQDSLCIIVWVSLISLDFNFDCTIEEKIGWTLFN